MSRNVRSSCGMSRQPWLSRCLWIALTATVLVACSRAGPKKDLGFYLVEDGIEFHGKLSDVDLRSVPLSDPPFIRLQDIVSYEWATHTMTLTPECQERLRRVFRLDDPKPMITHPFVLVVDDEPIYLGMLLSPLSAIARPGVPVIGIPLVRWDQPKLRIAFDGEGNDVRFDGKLRYVLAGAGVLAE
jgi:hypothetical protein